SCPRHRPETRLPGGGGRPDPGGDQFTELGSTTMYTTVPGARVPLRMWADPETVEDAAMAQLRNVTRLPWVHGVAVMPDVHYGKGATVGSVIAMRDAVSPAAVGVDIGCGMSAVRTSLTARDLPDNLRGLRRALEQAIPGGVNQQRDAIDRPQDAELWTEFAGLSP